MYSGIQAFKLILAKQRGQARLPDRKVITVESSRLA